ITAAVPVLRVVRDPRPVRARPKAQHVDAPSLIAVRARKAQLAEWNRHLGCETALVDLPRRVPDRVPRTALVAIDVVVDQVHLDAKRVDEELERAPLIVERVEDDTDEVV